MLLNVSAGEVEDVRAAVKLIHSSAHFARGDLLSRAYGTPTFCDFATELED